MIDILTSVLPGRLAARYWLNLYWVSEGEERDVGNSEGHG